MFCSFPRRTAASVLFFLTAALCPAAAGEQPSSCFLPVRTPAEEAAAALTGAEKAQAFLRLAETETGHRKKIDLYRQAAGTADSASDDTLKQLAAEAYEQLGALYRPARKLSGEMYRKALSLHLSMKEQDAEAVRRLSRALSEAGGSPEK